VPASSDAAATRDDQTPTEPAAATEPAQPVVIAAMPQKSAEQTIPATSGDFGDGHDQGSSVEKAEDPAQKPTDDAARKADAGFKSANVGFLAATPLPLDSKAAGPAGGGDFFKAVAGEPRALADDDALQADTVPSQSQFAEEAEVEPKVASFATAATPPEEAAATAPSVTEPEPKPIKMQKEPVIAAANEVSVGDGLSVSNILMSNDAGGIRTLEDTVADLLRPLLREWLENNMPRIVENALRIEVAESVKKQLDTSTRRPNGLS
jgi:cell pole-organizing protein PopZ